MGTATARGHFHSKALPDLLASACSPFVAASAAVDVDAGALLLLVPFRIEVGTETGVDRSKSVMSYLVHYFSEAGNHTVQVRQQGQQ